MDEMQRQIRVHMCATWAAEAAAVAVTVPYSFYYACQAMLEVRLSGE